MKRNSIEESSVYKNLQLPTHSDKPYIYSSFVMTMDGKVQVQKEGYWPIGSKTDYQTFTYLRAHADAILDGKNTARQFGTQMIETIHSEAFQELRHMLGKKNPLPYGIVTSQQDSKIIETLKNEYGFTPELVVTGDRSLTDCMQSLFQRGHRQIFVDGGPRLIASLLQENLIDEMFLTIAPKIFGNTLGETVTLAEGILFPPSEVKQFRVVSTEQVENEIYIRYRRDNA